MCMHYKWEKLGPNGSLTYSCLCELLLDRLQVMGYPAEQFDIPAQLKGRWSHSSSMQVLESLVYYLSVVVDGDQI